MVNSLNSVKEHKIFEYFIIICLFYITGGAFSYTRYSLQITCIFIFTFISFLFLAVKNGIPRVGFALILIQTIFIMLVPIFTSDEMSTYVAIIMQICVGMFCALLIPKERFIEKYVNVILVFAAISLVGFGVSLFIPQIVYRLPVIEGSSSVDYYNVIVYVFMRAKGYGGELHLMRRNAGICWEPGCYQAFLNLGLFFLFERQRKNFDKRFALKCFLLVITILTTVSTLGIIILIIQLIVFSDVLAKNLVKASIIFLVLPITLVAGYIILSQMGFMDLALEKFDVAFNNDGTASVWERISIDRIKYLVSDGRFWFFGMSFKHWTTYDITLWNSIIHSFLCLGIPFTLLQIYAYWKGAKAFSKHHVILFIILLMCFSTETLFWRVFFNTIAFYGFIEEGKTENIERIKYDDC